MKEILKQHCSGKDATGLLLLSMPTGFGKTHKVLDFIYDNYRDFAEQKRKIFFITSLKKNLPYPELKERFAADNAEAEYDKHVIFINSNSDSVIEDLLSVDPRIPDRFKVRSYGDLKSRVEIVKNEKIDRRVKTTIGEQIRKELEPDFRKYIIRQLNQEFKTKTEKLDAIKTNSDYQWIGDLYPAVFTDEKTIIFLSIDKFVRKNTPIIESSYYFQKRLIDGALIFIDEFDATKENVLKSIIGSGLKSQADILDRFLNIHNHLMENECPGILLQESRQRKRIASERGWPSLNTIITRFQDNADQISKKYNLQHTCKSGDGFSLNKRSFLFYDYQFHQVLDARNKRIEVVKDPESCTNWITASGGGGDPSGVDIRYLLRETAGFLTYFQRGVGYLAENYRQLKEEDDAITEDYPLEHAVRTVLNNFRLDSGTVASLTDNIMEHNVPYRLRRNTNAIQEQGFYEAGFSYYDIVDSEEHDTLSKIYMCTFSRTPESFMVEICSRAMVVGMSATAGLYTNIGNYDLEYLRSRLGDSFIRPSGAALQRIKKAISEANQGYDRVSVKTEFIGADNREESFAILESLLDDQEAANALWYKVLSKNPDEQKSHEYIFARYVRVLAAWNYFLENSDIRAFLCFFNAFPKRSDPRFDRETLYECAKSIHSRYPGAEGESLEDVMVILTGDDFDEKKPELLKSLEAGERRFILSTYQTTGAGQNLQYRVPDSACPVRINEFPVRGEMDIDAIYLDRPTHLLVNINSDEFKDEEFVKYLFQLEFLVENGAISPKTFGHKLDEAFHRLIGRYRKRRHIEDTISLYHTGAYTSYVNRMLIQAIGRICRTNMKSPTIHILADSSIRKYLAHYSLPDDVIPVREYAVLLESAREESAGADEQFEFQNRASNRSNRSAAFIRSFLKNPWDRSKVDLWQNLREQTLRQPVIPSKKDCAPEWYPIYVEVPSPARSYWYTQEGDYRNVEVFFSKGGQKQEVSEVVARLQELIAIEPLHDLFNERGWATGFVEGELMLTPPIFNNIYKGALGEVCGRHILQEHLDIPLRELDVSEYEKFDFKTENGIYFDFKLWNDSIAVPADDIIPGIQDKMRDCNARQVFVINILGGPGEKFTPTISSDRRIIEVPFVCQDGSLCGEALAFIQEELLR